MRRCGVPPPVIFERLNYTQQIICRRKGNLSESPNHFKYRNNILISPFLNEQFSWNDFPVAPEWLSEKLLKHKIYHFEARDLEIPNI